MAEARKKGKIFAQAFLFFVFLACPSFSEEAQVAAFLGVFSSLKLEDLEKALSQKVQEELQGIKWLDPKIWQRQLKEKGLENTADYLDLFQEREWQILLHYLGVRKAYFLNVQGYVEVETKEKAEVLLELEFVQVEQERKMEAKTTEEQVHIAKVTAQGYIQKTGKKKLGEARKEAIEESIKKAVSKLKNIPPERDNIVIGHKKSLLFHSPQAHHLPLPELQVSFSTIEEAREAGYLPCPIDFPALSPSTENLTSLEKILGQEASGEIERIYRLGSFEEHKRVEEVAQKLLPYTDLPSLRFIFRVLDTDLINAFATPGGVIYVSKGMLAILESDEELAAVLAHELSHVVRKHGLAQFKRYRDLALLGTLGNILTEGKLSLFIDFAQFLVLNGYDRRYEREADRDAIFFLYRAHIDPQVFLTVLQKLRDLEGSDPSKMEVYFRTHDAPQERIKRVQEIMSAKENYFRHLYQGEAQ